MAKQLEFTKEEQDQITRAIGVIAGILFKKMDEGVTCPQLEGTVDAKDSNRIMAFEFAALKTVIENA